MDGGKQRDERKPETADGRAGVIPFRRYLLCREQRATVCYGVARVSVTWATSDDDGSVRPFNRRRRRARNAKLGRPRTLSFYTALDGGGGWPSRSTDDTPHDARRWRVIDVVRARTRSRFINLFLFRRWSVRRFEIAISRSPCPELLLLWSSSVCALLLIHFSLVAPPRPAHTLTPRYHHLDKSARARVCV